MTILVGYAPSKSADAALDTALDIARSTGERVVVVNAGPGGEHRTKSLVTEEQQRGVQSRLDASGVTAEFRQYARGRSTVEEMKDVAAELAEANRRSGRRFNSGRVRGGTSGLRLGIEERNARIKEAVRRQQ